MIKTFTRKKYYHIIHRKSGGFKPAAFTMCTVFFVFFFGKIAHAQTDTLSNWRTITITKISDTLTLDSLSVIPSTVTVKDKLSGDFLDENIFLIINNKLIFREKINAKQGLEVTFRVFPFSLNAVASHKDTTRIGKQDFSDYIFRYEPIAPPDELFEFQGLDYQGSFARGISFGNNQDLVLNSSFNLQLAGDIGDDIEILAAISDNNIPLQPEGNTRQLQEFDQVFIQLKKDKSKLIAGDYQLTRPAGYFMNYNRRLQGLSFETGAKVGAGTLDGRISGAVARGQFARNQFNGLEGNQGPYKLIGANSERFLIVLAGTEKVFIDGILLQRGSEDDYTIDYNSGEIEFTANQLITKDKRIIIEFTYSTDNYLRTVYGTGLNYKTEKLNTYFNLFSEQDAKNQSVGQDLTDTQRQLFADAGDTVEDRLFPAVDTLPDFDPNRIMYAMVDSLGFDSVFVYTVNPDSAHFVLRFAEVGQRSGNYIPVQSSANGRIYAWVAPLADVPQGTHEPVVRLVAPQRKQLYTFGADYQLNKNINILTEVALSNMDLNTFSELDAGDNVGVAVRSRIENEFVFARKSRKRPPPNPLQRESVDLLQSKDKKPQLGLSNKTTNSDSLSTNSQNEELSPFGGGKGEEKPADSLNIHRSTLTIKTFVDYEFADANFRQIDPYRAVEFLRDWNTDRTAQIDEHLLNTGFNLEKKGMGNLRYTLGTYLRDSVYTGIKHSADMRGEYKGFNVDFSGSFLTSKGLKEDTRFFRPKANLSKTFAKLNNFKIGIFAEREDNRKYDAGGDTLRISSFKFDVLKAYLETGESQVFQWRTEYTRRYDYMPKQADLELATVADEVNLKGLWAKYKHSRLNWNLTYRNLRIQDSLLTQERPQETYLGRLEYLLLVKQGFVRANTVYELGSGQQQRIEFTYVQVNPGEGVYTWIDRNMDSVRQLDEFEIANFADNADHIRVTTFTNDFIRSNNVNFSQSVELNPVKLWRTSKRKTLKFLSKFRNVATFQIQRKTLESAEVRPWNPFELSVSDTSLVSLSANIRNTLFFNRTNQVFGVQFGMQDNRNRRILTTGYEARRRTEQSIKARWNPSKKVGTKLDASRGTRFNDSEFFQVKDYDIIFWEFSPIVKYIFQKNARLTLAYTFADRRNQINEKETTQNHNISTEFTYNKVSKSEISAKFSFVNVTYTGTRNTPVEYAMLDGLQNGKNFLWNLTFDRRISRNVLMSISYEGRKTGENKVVHIGRANVRATF